LARQNGGANQQGDNCHLVMMELR